MINHVEIKIDCIHQYDGAIPHDVKLEHLVNYYRRDSTAKLHAVVIEVAIDGKLLVTRNGFYIDIAKILGRKEIAATIINSSERIMETYDDCILIKDIRKSSEEEEKRAFNQIYRLVYFKDKLLKQDYESIIFMFDSFVVEHNIEVHSVSYHTEENYVTVHLNTTKLKFLDDANKLFIFLKELNNKFKIETLNGMKIERYLN